MSWTRYKTIRSVAIAIIAMNAVVLSHADEQIGAQPDYLAVSAAINQTMRAYHYDPAELDSPDYRQIETAVAELAKVATSDDAYIEGFRKIWEEGPFSHVVLNKAQQSAEALADYLDTIRIGGGGAVLSWQDDIAVLTVTTMMGLDTIEEIDAAFAQIADRDTGALIIDLRENGGGAFAIRPLVSHLVPEPVDAGVFVSQPWNAKHRRAPYAAEVAGVDPWEGWSIKTFWADVQSNAMTRVSFAPIAPVFAGPVYILTSARTASAAELATDALKGSGRAIIVGEKTAGQMLSQKMYDLPGGFQLSVPVADYYSAAYGRIEGVGIKPDIEAKAADAFDVVLRLLE